MNFEEVRYLITRLFREHIRKHLPRIFIALILSIIVAGSTSGIAWLLDPAVKKIFIDQDKTYAFIIPILIIVAFTSKGLSLYFARINIITVSEEVAGQLQNRFTVYKNPYMTENQILVGFRGSNFLETGAVYAPYVPLIMTPLVYDPSDFTPRKGVMTRYAKKMIRPEFYGKIAIKDLNLI